MPEPTRGTCVVCGCTNADCTRCVERTGQRCDWADEAQTLCTACVELTPQNITSLRAAVEAGKAETARLKLDAHTVETSMSTVADLASRLEAALARTKKAEAERDATLEALEETRGLLRVSREVCCTLGRGLRELAVAAMSDTRTDAIKAERDATNGWLAYYRTQLCQGDETLTDAITRVLHERDTLKAELTKLQEWAAGVNGAAVIAYPAGVGPHTREAFLAHRDAYHGGSEDYRVGADVVSAAVLSVRAQRDALRSELARLTTRHPGSNPPDTERDVLVECDDGAFRVDFWSRLHHRWDTVGVSIDATVTHWRELPPGPEVGP